MIRIPAPLLQHIEDAAQKALPRECCGLLVGRNEANGDIIITRVAASENVAIGDGRDRFEVDPQVRFDLMRELAGTDQEIVGHYHSHPGHPPEPSETDLDMAFEPDFVWLITTVDDAGQAGETRAWRLNRETDSKQEVTLSVIS